MGAGSACTHQGLGSPRDDFYILPGDVPKERLALGPAEVTVFVRLAVRGQAAYKPSKKFGAAPLASRPAFAST